MHLKRETGSRIGRGSHVAIEDFLVDEAMKLFLTRYGSQNLKAKAFRCNGVSLAKVPYRGLLVGFSVADEQDFGLLRQVDVPRVGPQEDGPSFVTVEFWVCHE